MTMAQKQMSQFLKALPEILLSASPASLQDLIGPVPGRTRQSSGCTTPAFISTCLVP